MLPVKKGMLVISLCLFVFSWSYADSDHSAMKSSENHSAHNAMIQKKNFAQRQVLYKVPDVELLDQNGKKVKLQKLLKAKEPYAVNFIFTTCSTICPIMTVSFSHMQRELGDDVDKLNFISISIDPEYDTPRVLREYSKKTRAEKNWTFLTGDYKTIIEVEKAFDSYTSDKMNHRPAYLLKVAEDDHWLRIDGFPSGTDLASIYRTLVHF